MHRQRRCLRRGQARRRRCAAFSFSAARSRRAYHDPLQAVRYIPGPIYASIATATCLVQQAAVAAHECDATATTTAATAAATTATTTNDHQGARRARAVAASRDGLGEEHRIHLGKQVDGVFARSQKSLGVCLDFTRLQEQVLFLLMTMFAQARRCTGRGQ